MSGVINWVQFMETKTEDGYNTINYNEIDKIDFTKGFSELLQGDINKYVHLFFDVDNIQTREQYNELIEWFDSIKPIFGEYVIGGYTSDNKMFPEYKKLNNVDKVISIHVYYYETKIKSTVLWELFRRSDAAFAYNNIPDIIDPSVYGYKSRHLLRHVYSNKAHNAYNIEKKSGEFLGSVQLKNTFVTIRGDEQEVDYNKIKDFFGLDINEIVEDDGNNKYNKNIQQHIMTLSDIECSDDDDNDDIEPEPEPKNFLSDEIRNIIKLDPSKNTDLFQVIIPIEIIREILFKHHVSGGYMDNLFNKGDPYYKSRCCLLLNCPYRKVDMKNLFYEWHNQKHNPHSKPWAAYQFVDELYEANYDSNEYYNGFIKCLKPPTFNDTLKELINIRKSKKSEEEKKQMFEDVEDYINNLSKKKNSLLSKKQRERKEKIAKLYSKLYDEYDKMYGDQNKIYNHYNNILTKYILACNDGRMQNYMYCNFLDTVSKKMLTISEGLETNPVSKYDLEQYYRFKPDLSRLIKTNLTEIKEIRQYQKTASIGRNITNEDIKIAEHFLNILKKSFANGADYNLYIDFIRFKLLNPNKKYKYNIASYGGTGVFKTKMMTCLKKFINVKSLKMEDLKNDFNEWAQDANIAMIEEAPDSVKEAESVRSAVKRYSDEYIGLGIKHKSNIKDTEIRFNLVINSNHKNFGGLFDNQSLYEMFRRFHIIERLDLTDEDKAEAGDIIYNNKLADAIFYYIMITPPLTTEDINKARETQKEYYDYVKNNKTARGALPLRVLRETIKAENGKTGWWVRLQKLVDALKNNGVMTLPENEKQILLNNNIVKIPSKGHYKIIDLMAYYKLYAVSETPEDDEDIEKTVKELINNPQNEPDEYIIL